MALGTSAIGSAPVGSAPLALAGGGGGGGAGSLAPPSIAPTVDLGAPSVIEPGTLLVPPIADDATFGTPVIGVEILQTSSATSEIGIGAPSIAEVGVQPPSIAVELDMTFPGVGGELTLNHISAVAKARLGAPRVLTSSLVVPSIDSPVEVGAPVLVKLDPPSISSPVALGTPSLDSPLLVSMSGAAKCILGLPSVIDAGKNFVLFIAGEDRTDYWRMDGGIEIVLGLNGKSSLKLTLVDTANAWRPGIANSIQFFLNGEKLFGGVIEDIEEVGPSGANDAIIMDIHANGYGSILDRRVVYGYWDEASSVPYPAFVADSIRVAFLEDDGFYSISAGLNQSPEFDSLFLAPMTANEAFNRISSATGIEYYVDQDKTIRWIDPATGSGAAPISITQADNLKRVVANSMRVRTLSGLYRNKTFVNLSRAIAPQITEELRPALNTPANVVFYSNFPIVEAPTLEITGSVSNYTPTVIAGPNLPSTDWEAFYQPGQQFITLNPAAQFFSDIGNVVSIDATYTVMDGLAGFVTAQDDTQIATRKAIEGGTGLWEAVENATDVETQDQAVALAEGLNARYAESGIPKEVSFETDYQADWRPGQVLTLDFTRPLAQGDFLITDVTIREESGSLAAETPWLRRSIKCSNAGLLRRRQQQVLANRGRSIDAVTFALARTITGLTNTGLATGTNIAGIHEITQGGLFADAHLVFETPPEGASIVLVVQTSNADDVDWTGTRTWTDLVTLTYAAERTDTLITNISAKARRGMRLRVNCTQVGSDVAGADGTLRLRILQ